MLSLVGGIPTPLKNMKVNGKDYPMYKMENTKCLKPPTSVIYVIYTRCPSSLSWCKHISPITVGLMNGGYIELVTIVYNQFLNWGGTAL